MCYEDFHLEYLKVRFFDLEVIIAMLCYSKLQLESFYFPE